MIITIDGPVASGKSSVAKRLAEELKMYYLYTGLFYRAVAYILLKKIEEERGEKGSFPIVEECAFEDFVKKLGPEHLDFAKNIFYDYRKDGDESQPHLFYLSEDITKKLFLSSLDQYASIVSAQKNVRDVLLDLQRDVAARYDIVADGRDCGTVVFPDADYKFYLTADVETRAQRLMSDKTRGELKRDLEKVKAEVEARDKRDQEREVAPLKVPETAVIIDNSSMTLEETVSKFLSHIDKK